MTGMEIVGVVNLAVGFLDKHGDDIKGFAGKVMGLADRAVGAVEKTATNASDQSDALRAIARKQDQLKSTLNEQTDALLVIAHRQSELKRTIKQSTEILGTLIKSESLAIIEKMERDRARSAIDELKADVGAMKAILAETNISKELTNQLVTQHLTPVRRNMIKAADILDESEDKNLGSCCRIVGLTALVAGYEYLGQNGDTELKQKLRDELLALQKRMLTQHARSVLAKGEEFDWERVPEMLSVKGAEALAQRLIISGDIDDTETEDVAPCELNISEAKQAVAAISDLDTLYRFTGMEYIYGRKDAAQGGRAAVMTACNNRWLELVPESDSEEEEEEDN